MTEAFYDDLSARLEARVGLTLKGKWRIDRLLGVGGMASVYAATHRNNKRVAVKMLHPELSMNPAIRQRFLREGYVANSVGHAGAVSVDDDDVTEDGCAFLVMELLDGETLDARWQRKGGRLEATEVLALMDQVLDTLAAAHEKGVVHRDLKPENLFLTQAGQVKVLDFGIARVKELSASGTSTQTGSLLGTPAFMPPEQARGLWAEVDGASDIWAVGASMFVLLTGQLVHPSATLNEALVRAVTEIARPVGTVGVAIPFEVAALVDRALAYDKVDRWPSASAMQEALREAYAAIANKPITLLDAVEDDIPASHFDADVPASPRGATAMDAVVASNSVAGEGARSLARRVRVPVVVGASVLCIIIVGLGLLTHSSAPRPAETIVERTSASVPSDVGNPLNEGAIAVENVPVVPVERLPVALPEAARTAAGDPRSQRAKPTLAAASIRPAVPAAPPSAGPPAAPQTIQKPSPLAGDPFSARH